MIVHLLAVSLVALAPSDFHSTADMDCPAGAISCEAYLPDWVYRVQAPNGPGVSWAPFTVAGGALPWRMVCRAPGRDTLVFPVRSSRPDAADSAWGWDARGRFPSTGAFVEFATPGASGEIAIEARDRDDEAWIPVGRQSCWNSVREDSAFRQDTLRWNEAKRYRFWRVRPLGSVATLGGAPRLVLRVRRDRLEVATGGVARLVFGAGLDPERPLAQVAFPASVPRVPGEGRIGGSRTASGEAAWSKQIPTRTWVLWTTLVVFLCGLAALAWKLLREAFGKANRPD
jgi:hypothetical protein